MELFKCCRTLGYNDLIKFQDIIDNNKDEINSKKNGQTPLMIVCKNGSFELAKILIDNGADINIINSGKTAFTYILQRLKAKRGVHVPEDLEILQLFIEKDIVLDKLDINEMIKLKDTTILKFVVSKYKLKNKKITFNPKTITRNKIDHIKVILLSGMIIENITEIILTLVSKNRNKILDEFITKLSIDITNLKTIGGKTVNLLVHAILNKNYEMTNKLLSNNVNLNKVCECGGCDNYHWKNRTFESHLTPLMALDRIWITKSYKRRKPTGRRRRGGWTHEMIKTPNKKAQIIFQTLIKMGVDVNKKNSKEVTALWQCVFSRNYEFLKLLVDNGINVDSTYKGFNVIYVIISETINRIQYWNFNENEFDVYMDIIQLFIKKGLNINCCDKEQNNAIQVFIKFFWKFMATTSKYIMELFDNCHRIQYSTKTEIFAIVERYFNKILNIIDINHQNIYGQTIFHTLINHQLISPSILDSMSKAGCNINLVDHNGNTVLHCLITSLLNNIHIIITETSNQVNLDNFDIYLLKIIKWFVINNSDFYIKNNNGKSVKDLFLDKQLILKQLYPITLQYVLTNIK